MCPKCLQNEIILQNDIFQVIFSISKGGTIGFKGQGCRLGAG